MAAWYKEWFESENYLKVYGHRDDSDAHKIIDLILHSIDIKKKSNVLDAACGAGRHSVYLSERGFNVFAFDLSNALLNNARCRAAAEKADIALFRADLRYVSLKQKIDLVINLFTSFGYFESDEENFSFARNAYEFLKEGGYYVLDYINKPYIVKNLVPESERIIEGINIVEKRYIKDDRIEKVIEINGDRYIESVKLYASSYVIEKFLEIGFKVSNIFGSYDGAGFDEQNSERLIVILRK